MIIKNLIMKPTQWKIVYIFMYLKTQNQDQLIFLHTITDDIKVLDKLNFKNNGRLL